MISGDDGSDDDCWASTLGCVLQRSEVVMCNVTGLATERAGENAEAGSYR